MAKRMWNIRETAICVRGQQIFHAGKIAGGVRRATNAAAEVCTERSL
jgi:hypothetical protein